MILKLLSRLIDYPDGSLHEHQQDLIQIIQDSSVPETQKQALLEFVENRLAMDLLDWQGEYDGLFERGRSVSLLLFEHVHGESRDRGQAMVNLSNQYKQAGLHIDVKELPDYIPLYLEFVSTQPQDQQANWLADVGHIFALITARLQKRGNNYAALFDALLSLSAVDIDLADVHAQIANEKADHSREAIDKVWEEEAITFGGDAVNGGCPTQQQKPSDTQDRSQEVPIQFLRENKLNQELSAAVTADKGV